MDVGRKFTVDSLIFSLPPPPTNDTPSAAIANASAVTSAPQTSSFPPPPPTNQHHKGTGFSAVAVGAGIGFGGAIMLVIMGSLVIWYLRRKRDLAGSCEAPPHKTNDDDCDGPNQQWMHGAPSRVEDRLWFPQKPVCLPNTPSDNTICSSSDSEKPFSHCLPGLGLGHLISTFTFEELALATDGFSSNNLLGVGGFGYVHKGILSNGKEVAVKQLKTGSGQGEREFQSEVETISRINHKHLVSLVGYCSTGDQRLLVYEFVPNKTLDFHIHGKRGEPHLSNWAPLNWAARMKVALGSAKGLAFLHEDCQPKIIHRDIKAANILLDNSFEAKVSDFGLARFTLDTDTHVSTRVIGTFGYIAPEYAQTGKLTVRSDVFSFGVMLLELITGRRPIDKNEGQFCKEDNIVDWARPLLTQAVNNANFDTLADARLPKDYNFTEMSRMVTCAAACVRHLARLRPKMSQIVQALEGKISLDVLKEGRTMSGSSLGSSDFDSVASMHDKEKFRKLMYKNLENSSEYSGLNSDFTQQPSVSSSEFPHCNRYMDSSGERGKAETNQNTQSQEIGEKR